VRCREGAVLQRLGWLQCRDNYHVCTIMLSMFCVAVRVAVRVAVCDAVCAAACVAVRDAVCVAGCVAVCDEMCVQTNVRCV